MRIFVKFVLSAAVLLTIAWKFDFSAAVRLLSTISIGTIVGCLLLLLFQAWIAGVRLSKAVTLLGHRLELAPSYRMTLEGMFFNQGFISFLGGDAWKIWRLQLSSVPLADATAAVVLDRVIGFAINHLVLLLALPWIWGSIESAVVKIGLLMLAAAGIAGFGLLLALGIVRDRFAFIIRSRWHDSAVAVVLLEVATVGRHVVMSFRKTLQIGAISLPIVAVNSLLFYIVLRNFNTAPSQALDCALLVPAIMEITLLPVSISGWGIREGTVIFAFGALRLEPEIALAASVAFGLFGLAVGLVGGAVLMIERRRRQDAQPPVTDEARSRR